MELIEDRMADLERRRVSLDDVKKMFKARMQREIEQTEADLAKNKSSIFNDPLIQQEPVPVIDYGIITAYNLQAINHMRNFVWNFPAKFVQ